MATHESDKLVGAFLDKYFEASQKIDKAAKATEDSIKHSEKRVTNAIENMETSVEKAIKKANFDNIKIGSVHIDSKEFKQSAKQLVNTINSVVDEIQDAADRARSVDKILDGIDFDKKVQGNVKKAMPNATKEQQNYLTKLLTAMVKIGNEYDSMVSKITDNTSGKAAMVAAKEYTNVMEEMLNITQQLKLESADLINTNAIEAKINVVTTAMQKSGKIITKSLKPVEEMVDRLINMKGNLKLSENGEIIGEKPNKSDYTKKSIYQKAITNTDRYDVDKYLNWDKEKHTKSSDKELDILLNRLRKDGYGKAQAKLSSEVQARYVGLMSKALAEANLDVKKPILDDVLEKINNQATQEALDYYISLINKGVKDSREVLNYNPELEQLAMSMSEKILSTTTSSSVDVTKITQDHENLVNILKKEKLEAEEIVSLFEEFSKLTQDEKNSISNILGDNKNLKNLLDLVQKTNGDLEKMKGLLGLVGGQGGSVSSTPSSSTPTASVEKLEQNLNNIYKLVNKIDQQDILSEDYTNPFGNKELQNFIELLKEIENVTGRKFNLNVLLNDFPLFENYMIGIVEETDEWYETISLLKNEQQLQMLKAINSNSIETAYTDLFDMIAPTLQSKLEEMLTISPDTLYQHFEMYGGLIQDIIGSDAFYGLENKLQSSSPTKDLEADVSSFITTVTQLENFKSADPQWLADYTDKIRKSEIELSTALDEYKNKLAEKMQQIAEEQERNRINNEQVQLFAKEFGDTNGFDSDKLAKYTDILNQISSGAISAADGIEKFKNSLKTLEGASTPTVSPVEETKQVEELTEANDRNNHSLAEKLEYLKEIQKASKFMEDAEDRRISMEEKAYDVGGNNPKSEADSLKKIQMYEDLCEKIEQSSSALDKFTDSYEKVLITMKNGSIVEINDLWDLDGLKLLKSQIQDIKFVLFEEFSTPALPLAEGSGSTGNAQKEQQELQSEIEKTLNLAIKLDETLKARRNNWAWGDMGQFIEDSANGRYQSFVQQFDTSKMNDDQKKYFIERAKSYAELVVQTYNDQLYREANNPSSVFTGGSGFNKNAFDKKLAAEMKAMDEYERKMGSFVENTKKKLKELTSAEDQINAFLTGKQGYGEAISSDDPLALDKLKAKLSYEQRIHQEMIEANKEARKAKETAPYAPYMLQNSNQRIKQIQDRIADVFKQLARGTEDIITEYSNGVKLIKNAQNNRLQFKFEGKPEEDTRTVLKSNGFKWANSQGAWQRQWNNNGEYAVKKVVELLKLEEIQAKETSEAEENLNKARYSIASRGNTPNASKFVKTQKKLQGELKRTEEQAEKTVAKLENVGYHAGIISRLNKAETNGRFYGGNRGTGYYGTGHYFVDAATRHEIDNNNYYSKLPYTSVDISQYDNLFKATTDKVAGELHTFLRNITRFTQGIDSYNISQLFSQFQNVFGNSVMSMNDFEEKINELTMFMQNSDGFDRSDSVSTQFMKSLGYGGVDTRGTKYANTEYGIVIYDLKEESILQANITDELQKQGQMLEKINYEKGQVFDKSEDAKIQRILDAQAYSKEIKEETNRLFDGSNLDKYQDELDIVNKKLKDNQKIIYDLQRSLDNMDSEINRHSAQLEMFGLTAMTDEEKRELSESRTTSYTSRIDELTKENELLSQQIALLEVIVENEEKVWSIAYTIAKQKVENRRGGIDSEVSQQELDIEKEKLAVIEKQFETQKQIMFEEKQANRKYKSPKLKGVRAETNLKEKWEDKQLLKTDELLLEDDLIEEILLNDDKFMAELEAEMRQTTQAVEELTKAEIEAAQKAKEIGLAFGITNKNALKEFQNVLLDFNKSKNMNTLQEDENGFLIIPSVEDEFDLFTNTSIGLNDVLDTISKHIKSSKNDIASYVEAWKEVRKYVSSSKIAISDKVKSEFGDDFNRMRTTIGMNVLKTDRSGLNIIKFLTDMNSVLGTTFDLTKNDQDAFRELYEFLRNKPLQIDPYTLPESIREVVNQILDGTYTQISQRQNNSPKIKGAKYNKDILEANQREAKSAEETTHAIEAQTEAIENNTKAKEKNNKQKSKGYDYLEHATYATEDVEAMLQKVIDNSGNIPRDKAKTSVTSSADGTITGGTITYVDDALKRTVTEVYSLKKLTDEMAEATGDVMESEQALVLLYKKATDDGIARAKQEEKAREKEKKDLDEIHAKQLKYQGEIDRVKREALEHATRPIRSEDRIAEANTAHENLTEKINTYLGDGVISISKSALQEIETAIADYKALVNRLQSKDNVPTMATTDFENKKAQSIAKIEGLITELQQAGNYTSDLRKEAEDLWVKLNEVGSGDELLPLAKAIGTIAEKFRALRKEHNAEIQKQKEIQDQYNENINVIKQLETETDKLNNMMASDIGKDRMHNQIEDQFNKTVDAAEKAKKAIQDVDQMFKAGQINAGQHKEAGNTYKEAKQGSTTSQARYEDAKASEAKAQAAKNEKAAIDNLKESLKNLISAYTQLTSVSTKPGENSFTNALEQAKKARAIFGDMYSAAQEAGVDNNQLVDVQKNALVKLNESVSQSGAKAFDSYIAKIEEAMNKLGSLDRLTEEARNEFSELAQKLNEANKNKDLSSLDGIDKYIENIARYKSIVDEEVKRISQASQIGSFQTQIAELDQMNVKSVRFTSLLGEVKQRLKEFNDFKNKTSDKQLISDKEVQLIKQLSPMINDLYKQAQGKGNLVPESAGQVTDVIQLERAMNSYAQSLGFTKQVGQVTRNENDQLTISFANGKNEILKVTGSIDSLNQALRQTSVISKNTGGFITNLKASFKQMVGYFTRYYTGYTMMTRAIGGFRKGIEIVKEFDAAMTELHKVSNDTEAELNRFGKEAFNIAETIGSTGKEIINSAADWEKLGYAIEDASELAKNSALYSNVGDMDIDTATEHMVSTLKAYKEFDAQNSQLIVDKFNEIGNNYAITSEGIGAALERSASTLVAANNDLDQSIALITAGE